MSDKLARFNELRVKYGFLAKCVKADRLVAQLAYSTGYDMFVSGLPNGRVRRTVLNRFVRRAENSDGMLCDFLSYFDKSGAVGESGAAEGGNTVRIMSMHAAKGLEFPVVVLPCLEADFVVEIPRFLREGSLALRWIIMILTKRKFSPTLRTRRISLSTAENRRRKSCACFTWL